MPTHQAMMCPCGTQMEDNGLGAFLCSNCDTVQPMQYLGYTRRKTTQDIRYEMHWVQVIDSEYKDNTKPESNEDSAPTDGGTEDG
jgi:hypothetical protein